MDSTSIGLDIGSSAVRAAEIGIEKNQRKLRRYGQVGLAPGSVVDGEVVNPGAVSEALRRLWAEGGFSSNKVVLGVSGHRLIVRQADVPALNDEDLRSSLRFDAQELIPIPMEDATFDFQVLERGGPAGDDGRSTMRILIVAAHRELLRGHLVALEGAGLEAVAIDASPLALLRVVPPAGPDSGVEALVAIGAELTTVAVRQGGMPRFIRSLAVGGSKLTAGIANSMHLDPAVAESLKRGYAPAGAPQLAQARKAMSSELRDLGEDVRATMDFFVSQADGSRIERLLVTGGASQTEGLIEQMAGGLDLDIRRIDPFVNLMLGDLGLDTDSLARARATAATAVGLALWTADAPSSRLSVLPGDVAAARKTKRIAMMAAAGVAGVAALLVVATGAELVREHVARAQVQTAQRQVAVLHEQVSKLQTETAVHQKAITRAGMVKSALRGDVDWVRVISEIQAVTPGGLGIQTMSAARSNSPSATSGSASSTASSIGNISFSVGGTGDLPLVAAWIDGLQQDPSLQGTWVAGVTVSPQGNKLTFNSTTNLTPKAESNRAQAVNS